jgi:hypothetical protein
MFFELWILISFMAPTKMIRIAIICATDKFGIGLGVVDLINSIKNLSEPVIIKYKEKSHPLAVGFKRNLQNNIKTKAIINTS